VSREAIWEELAPDERVSGVTVGGVATMGGCARKTKKGRCVSHPSRGMKKGVGAVVDPVAQPGSGPS
jgi:hypothetical protein